MKLKTLIRRNESINVCGEVCHIDAEGIVICSDECGKQLIATKEWEVISEAKPEPKMKEQPKEEPSDEAKEPKKSKAKKAI